MDLYSIKMRASRTEDGKQIHVSGAEKIAREEDVEKYCALLLNRAKNHSKGKPDFINIKVELVKEEEILYLDALPVTTIPTSSWQEGRKIIKTYLHRLGFHNTDIIFEKWADTYAMRGAMLLDCDTMERLEPDKQRGIRATYMDMITDDEVRKESFSGKNHFNEALVLATKVVHHPNILAEICISDDPDYVTGYIASSEFGYVRITNLKPMGSPDGGRVFLFRGNEEEKEDVIDYLEHQKVLVRVKS